MRWRMATGTSLHRTSVSDDHEQTRHAEALSDWLQSVLKIRTSNEEFYRFYHQAVEDMAALRLPIEGTDHMEFVPAAGVPWFVGSVRPRQPDRVAAERLVYPDFARGSLDVLGRCRRPSATTIATPSPARSCTSCATASWPTSS